MRSFIALVILIVSVLVLFVVFMALNDRIDFLKQDLEKRNQVLEQTRDLVEIHSRTIAYQKETIEALKQILNLKDETIDMYKNYNKQLQKICASR